MAIFYEPPSASAPTVEDVKKLLSEYSRLAATIPAHKDLALYRAQKIRLLGRIEIHLARDR